jgi:three-Cys-motif partner protein
MQVSWETLVAVAETRAIDMWILFPSGVALNRLLTKSGEIRMEWQEALDRFLGCPDWRTAFYRERQVYGFFREKSTELVKVAGTKDYQAFFLDRLRTIFPGVAPETVPLMNASGRVMYLLCFACGNKRGAEIALRIAKSVMRPRLH